MSLTISHANFSLLNFNKRNNPVWHIHVLKPEIGLGGRRPNSILNRSRFKLLIFGCWILKVETSGNGWGNQS